MGPSSRPSGAASWLSTLLVPPILALFTVAPLAHQPATTAHEHSRLAPPASESDFNGDGFADLAVGVPNEDLGPIADAGAVNVLFGTPSGLQASAPEDQLITQALGPGEGPEAGDRFGAGLATADFNGDGYSDLAVGAAGEDVGTTVDAGAVSAIYGSPDGLQATDPPVQLWTQDSPGVEDQAEASDQLGLTVVTANFNGDGFDDLGIGVPFEDVDGVPDAGSTNVLYGSSQGLQTTAPPDQFWTQNSPGVEDEAGPEETFSAVAAGDFNGDGFADLVNGVPGESVGGAPDAGAINVLHGSAQGLQATAPPDQFWTQDVPWVDGAAEAGDGFGRSGTAGDFNGDGYDDVVVGVPGQDVEGHADAGAINVLYGSSVGLQTDDPDDPVDAPDDQLWTQDSPFLSGLAEAGDLFGSQMAAGDLNGDGRADLAVGPNGEDIEQTMDAGGINQLYGSSFGLQAVLPDDQLWSQDADGVKDMAEPGDRFAWDIAALDFNGDGFGDLAVGVPGEDLGSLGNGGAVAVLYGSAAGVQADSPDDQFWSQDSPGVKETAGFADGFGAQLDP